jgi:hypothetical protein
VPGSRGRIARVPVRESRISGVQTVRWDGKADGVKDAGSGLYFFRLTAGQRMDGARILPANRSTVDEVKGIQQKAPGTIQRTGAVLRLV